MRRNALGQTTNGVPPSADTHGLSSPRSRLILESALLPCAVYTTWACEAYTSWTAMKPKKDGYGEEKKKAASPCEKAAGESPGEAPGPAPCSSRPGSVPIIDVKRAR